VSSASLDCIVCDNTSPLLDVTHCGVAFSCCHVPMQSLLWLPAPSASLDGGISQLVLHVENGMFSRSSSNLMCGTSAPPRDYELTTSTLGASGAALLLLLRLACCCCCCCWRTLTPPGVRWCPPGQNNKAPQEIRPAHFAPHARSAQHAPARFRRSPRTGFPRFPRNKTPKYCPPIEETRLGNSPARSAPHTVSGARRGGGGACLLRSRR
jgi:hypothetical protein